MNNNNLSSWNSLFNLIRKHVFCPFKIQNLQLTTCLNITNSRSNQLNFAFVSVQISWSILSFKMKFSLIFGFILILQLQSLLWSAQALGKHIKVCFWFTLNITNFIYFVLKSHRVIRVQYPTKITCAVAHFRLGILINQAKGVFRLLMAVAEQQEISLVPWKSAKKLVFPNQMNY